MAWPAPADARPVNTARAACTLTKTRVAALENFPVSIIAFCDVVPAAHSPRGYYVLTRGSEM